MGVLNVQAALQATDAWLTVVLTVTNAAVMAAIAWVLYQVHVEDNKRRLSRAHPTLSRGKRTLG